MAGGSGGKAVVDFGGEGPTEVATVLGDQSFPSCPSAWVLEGQKGEAVERESGEAGGDRIGAEEDRRGGFGERERAGCDEML